MNCNLKVQAGPEIKGEVTSPSWENREKFAASREKCFRTKDTQQKHGYIISSYEPLADLFKNAARNFFVNLCFIHILFLFFKEANSEEYLKKKKSKKNYVYKF